MTTTVTVACDFVGCSSTFTESARLAGHLLFTHSLPQYEAVSVARKLFAEARAGAQPLKLVEQRVVTDGAPTGNGLIARSLCPGCRRRPSMLHNDGYCPACRPPKHWSVNWGAK